MEIEDVLSSIRRLVSDDLRPANRTIGRIGPAPSTDKLILTPSLRVVANQNVQRDDAVPPLAQRRLHLMNPLSEPEGSIETVAASLETAVAALAEGQQWESEAGDPAPIAEMDWTDSDWTDTAETVMFTHHVPNAPGAVGHGPDTIEFVDLQLTDTVDVIEALTQEIVSARAEADAFDDIGQPAADIAEPVVEEVVNYYAGTVGVTPEMALPDFAEQDFVEEILDDATYGVDAADTATATSSWSQDETDAAYEADATFPDPLEWSEPGTLDDDEPLDPEWADRAEAEVVAALSDAAEERVSQFSAAAELTYDEDVLRDLVRDLIREELQGGLGERITRNVRKLVRAEIARALAMQSLD